jgi:hypothetical protein
MPASLTLDIAGNVFVDGIATGQQLGDFLVYHPEHASAVNTLLFTVLVRHRQAIALELTTAYRACETAHEAIRARDARISELEQVLSCPGTGPALPAIAPVPTPEEQTVPKSWLKRFFS